MRHATVLNLLIACALCLPACSSDVANPSSTGQGGSGGASTGEGGSGGGGGEGGANATTTTSSGGGAGGGTLTAECIAMAPLVFSDAQVSPGWSPGQDAGVSITLTNPGAVDIQYPGAVVTADHPGVTTLSPVNYFFVLPAGMSNIMDFPFNAESSVPSGTTVDFEVTAIDIQGTPCPNVQPLNFNTTLE